MYNWFWGALCITFLPQLILLLIVAWTYLCKNLLEIGQESSVIFSQGWFFKIQYILDYHPLAILGGLAEGGIDCIFLRHKRYMICRGWSWRRPDVCMYNKIAHSPALLNIPHYESVWCYDSWQWFMTLCKQSCSGVSVASHVIGKMKGSSRPLYLIAAHDRRG